MTRIANIFLNCCVVFTSSLVLFPIVLSSTNFWDGVIFSYAVDSRNLDGLSVTVKEAGYHFTSIFASGAIIIAEFINRDYFFIHKIFSIFIFLFFTREMRLLTINALNFTKKQASVTYMLVCIFPIWHLLQQSTFDYFFFFVAIGLLGVRYYNSAQKLKVFLGFLCIILSFQVGSMFTFALALHIVSDKKFANKISKNFITSKKSKTLILASLSFWCLTKVFFKPNGVYKDYNSLFIPDTLQDLIRLFNMTKITFGYLSIFGITLLVLYVFQVSIIRKSFLLEESLDRQNIDRINKSFFLFIFSLLPYLAVGKVSPIRPGSLESRFLLLLCITIPIVLVSMLISASHALHIQKIKIRKAVLATAVVPYLFLTIPTTIQSQIYYLNHQIFTKKLFNSLGDFTSSIPPGFVRLESSSRPLEFSLSIYDSNYQLWRLYGDRFFWSKVVESPEEMLEFPNWAKSNPNYFHFYATSPPPSTFCETKIRFTATGFSSWIDRVLNVVPYAKTDSQVLIDSVESVCSD